MYVVRFEFERAKQIVSPEGAMFSFVLRSLNDPNSWVRFDTFEAERLARAAHGEVHRLLFEVKGPWTDAPSHAVYAAWQVSDPARAASFEDSRRELFELRREVLATFAYDWLLKSLDHEGLYLVLGLYGDEEGATRLCREHPRIQNFIRANPAVNFSATDLTGLRCFRIENAEAQ